MTCPRLSMRHTSSWPRKQPLVNDTASCSRNASCGMVELVDVDRLHAGCPARCATPRTRPARRRRRRRGSVLGRRPDQVVAPAGAEPRATPSGRDRSGRRRRRRRGRACRASPVRSTTSAFTRILNRLSDAASCAPSPGSQSSHASSPTRSEAEVDVELALRRAAAGCAPRRRRPQASRSADTNAWRNENASGPVTTTKPRSERSTHASPARSAARSSVRVDSCTTSRVAERREAAGRGRGGEQRPRLVVALEVLVGRVPSRRRCPRPPARSRDRRATPSCGWRSRCRGCPRSRRSRPRPAYGPRFDRLELVDDLHRPHLRRAAHRAGRERGAQHVDRVGVRRARSPATWLVRCITWE